ncbi:MAG: hypothetical protein M3M96_01750 [Candidatus Eremiobacteraeota bacterium]|nr:hypothetical protein [Candidatus Eremiobacteraeota bacterium]
MNVFRVAGATVASALLFAGCGGSNATPPGPVAPLSVQSAGSASFDAASMQTAMNSGAFPATPGAYVRSASRRNSTSVAPDAKAPAILATLIETGLDQTGVPCIACVGGAQTSANVGLTQPLGYIAASVPRLQYVFFYEDFSFTGTCNFAVTVTAGTTILFNAPFSLAISPNSTVYSSTGGPRPAYTGPALLAGKITCPGIPVASVSTKLYFQ